MPRFFIDQPCTGSVVEIDGENGRHITFSLRMRPGELITLCDGQGTDYLCEIQSFSGELVTAHILQTNESLSEPQTKLHLYQSFPKGDKLESIIQKVTELGAASVTPVISERCIARPDEKSARKKLLRLQKIALEAAKQSGRGRVPAVCEPLSFAAAIQQAKEQGDILFFYECGGISLAKLLPETGSVISVFIGPEGGFSEKEALLAAQNGAKTATLGRRILRTETAPVAALSVLLFGKGDMSL